MTQLLDAQEAFLSGGGAFPISPPARKSFLEILHALGGGLAGVGFASLLLVHYGVRRGQRWAAGAMAGAIVLAEGANMIGMYRLDSPFYMVTLAYLVLLATGLGLLFVPTFAMPPSPGDKPSA